MLLSKNLILCTMILMFGIPAMGTPAATLAQTAAHAPKKSKFSWSSAQKAWVAVGVATITTIGAVLGWYGLRIKSSKQLFGQLQTSLTYPYPTSRLPEVLRPLLANEQTRTETVRLINESTFTVLHDLIDRGAFDIAISLARYGARCDFKRTDRTNDSLVSNWTTLHALANATSSPSDGTLAQLLIDHGANPNAQIQGGQFNGLTPIEFARKRHPQEFAHNAIPAWAQPFALSATQ